MQKKSYLVILIALLIFINGCAINKFSDPFSEAIYVTHQNHINKHELKDLVFEAISNIEDEIYKNDYKIRKLEIDWEQLKNNDDYISITHDAYEYYTNKLNENADEVIYSSLKALFESIDKDSSFIKPEEFEDFKVGSNRGGIGIEIKLEDGIPVVIAPIDNSSAYIAGIKKGDRIIEIDGKSVDHLDLSEIVALLRGPLNSVANINIIRDGSDEPLQFNIKREIVTLNNVSHEYFADVFLYIKILNFNSETNAKLLNILNYSPSIQGLILDLRKNPGGLLKATVDVSSVFLGDGLLVTTIRGRNKDSELSFKAKSQIDHQDYPMVVLVDGQSAAGAEIMASALRNYNRAIIIGTKTFGFNKIHTIIPLIDGAALRLVTAHIYLADGSALSDEGIEPDIIIDNDKNDDYDKQLDVATRLIKNVKGLKSHSAISAMIEHYNSNDTVIEGVHNKLMQINAQPQVLN